MTRQGAEKSHVGLRCRRSDVPAQLSGLFTVAEQRSL